MTASVVPFVVLCTSNVILGKMLGYESPAAYLAFWLLAAVLAVAAWNVAVRAFAPTGLADGCVRCGVVMFAVVVLCGLVLGVLGQITIGGYLVAQCACLGASFLLPPRPAPVAAVARPQFPA